MVNAKVEAGQNVLITGVGGGVAILALQLCIAKGANVYVTSGSEEKIRKAVALGAKGGANYKDGQSCVLFFFYQKMTEIVRKLACENRRNA